jgi:hypothetical protein
MVICCSAQWMIHQLYFSLKFHTSMSLTPSAPKTLLFKKFLHRIYQAHDSLTTWKPQKTYSESQRATNTFVEIYYKFYARKWNRKYIYILIFTCLCISTIKLYRQCCNLFQPTMFITLWYHLHTWSTHLCCSMPSETEMAQLLYLLYQVAWELYQRE